MRGWLLARRAVLQRRGGGGGSSGVGPAALLAGALLLRRVRGGWCGGCCVLLRWRPHAGHGRVLVEVAELAKEFLHHFQLDSLLGAGPLRHKCREQVFARGGEDSGSEHTHRLVRRPRGEERRVELHPEGAIGLLLREEAVTVVGANGPAVALLQRACCGCCLAFLALALRRLGLRCGCGSGCGLGLGGGRAVARAALRAFAHAGAGGPSGLPRRLRLAAPGAWLRRPRRAGDRRRRDPWACAGAGIARPCSPRGRAWRRGPSPPSACGAWRSWRRRTGRRMTQVCSLRTSCAWVPSVR